MPETADQSTAKEIQGQAKTVRALLSGIKYSIDYYQREYKWEEKHIKELINDLTGKFREDYDGQDERRAVRGYGHYFLGSIIISRKDGANFIIDGQQRLTSLTLLLIYLRNTQKARGEASTLDQLIFSEQYGERSFNIRTDQTEGKADERDLCMEALYQEQDYDTSAKSETVQNLVARYEDIEENFPEELKTSALPYFADWLVENVHIVEITAYSDDDAYAIFETMNDRGLSLSPIEMLKGYLLANIEDEKKRAHANKLWKDRVLELHEQGKDIDADAFKGWLRSQYAESIRERKKGATAQDWDRIGTEFHRWVRDNRTRIGLNGSDSYSLLIERNFDFYSKQYLRLVEASANLTPGLEPVFYNAQHGFTLQYQVLLAPLTLDDAPTEIDLKIKLAAMYIDILLNRRIWNFHSIAYSTMQYAMFLIMRDIRGKGSKELAELLRARLEGDHETFSSNPRFILHQQNRKYLQRILARLTDFVETESEMPSHYVEYTTGKGMKKFEIEHIWANKPARHKDEFPSATDFEDYRNRIGDLLLLPKPPNASLNDAPYEDKLTWYDSQNLLARSLNPNAYQHNPTFKRFIERSGLPFHPYTEFKKANLDERQALYIQIAEQLWNPVRLTELVK